MTAHSTSYAVKCSQFWLHVTLFTILDAINHFKSSSRKTQWLTFLPFCFVLFFFCCTGNLEQVIVSLLATGVGAGFGATSDLKENLDQLDRFTARIGYPVLSEIRPKGDNFFNTVFVSASLLLMGFLCSAVSSIIPS